METTANPAIANRHVLMLLRITWIALAVIGITQVSTFLAHLRLAVLGSPAQLPTDGLSPVLYFGYFALLTILAMLVFFGVSAVMIWRREPDRISVLVAMFLLAIGSSPVDTYLPIDVETVLNAHPLMWLTVPLLGLIAWCGFLLFFTLFPDGRVAPRWARYVIIYNLIFTSIWNIAPPFSPLYPLRWPPALFLLVSSTGLGSALAVQIYRYRNISNAHERQQTKWVVYGFALLVPILVIYWALFPVAIPKGISSTGIDLLRGMVGFSLVLIPVTIAFAILRYRLWDIDLIIRRTLMYSAITALLAGVYFGAVTILQALFSQVIGSESPLAVVISTLAIAALFTPVRVRVQNFLDRRFNRQRYNAELTLEAFAEAVRDDVDMDHLSAVLIGVVQETMQPESVGLWLAPAEAEE